MTAIPASTVQLESHLACHACEYDLHSLSPSGECPECGVAVAASIEADERRRAERPRDAAIGMFVMVMMFACFMNFALANNPAFVLMFTIFWSIIGIGSMGAVFVTSVSRPSKWAVVPGLGMLLSVPAVFFNLFGILMMASAAC